MTKKELAERKAIMYWLFLMKNGNYRIDSATGVLGKVTDAISKSANTAVEIHSESVVIEESPDGGDVSFEVIEIK
jgi:hypothetical protein